MSKKMVEQIFAELAHLDRNAEIEVKQRYGFPDIVMRHMVQRKIEIREHMIATLCARLEAK